MIIPEYTQGDWYAAVAEGVVVMLPPTATPALVRETWAALRDGAGFDGQVSLLGKQRADDLPALAVVDVAEGRVRAVLRGGIEVEVIAHGVPTILGGHSTVPLAEQVVSDAELVSVRAPARDRGPDRRERSAVHMPVLAAVVGAQSVRIQLRAATSSSQINELTIERPRAAALAAVPAPVTRGRRQATGRHDHDGQTVHSTDLADVRRQLPEWGDGAVPGPFRVPGSGAPAKLRLSTGLVVSLDRAVLLGRAPQVSRVANAELPRLVTVASPEQDISRTHAEVRVEGDDVLVTDLHSTNGVLVTPAGEAARRLHPGEPTLLRPGTVVDLGEGVTFSVERG
jgi:hypothetical protein